MFQTYILESIRNSKYYIGSCKNIDLRLKQHNAGVVKSTKPNLPWRVVYSERFETRMEAVSREKQIKNWKRRASICRLIENFNRGSSMPLVGH